MPTTLDTTRIALTVNVIACGVGPAPAAATAGAWSDWIALGATPAEQDGRKTLALQATAKYSTQAFDGARASDLADAVTAALVVTA